MHGIRWKKSPAVMPSIDENSAARLGGIGIFPQPWPGGRGGCGMVWITTRQKREGDRADNACVTAASGVESLRGRDGRGGVVTHPSQASPPRQPSHYRPGQRRWRAVPSLASLEAELGGGPHRQRRPSDFQMGNGEDKWEREEPSYVFYFAGSEKLKKNGGAGFLVVVDLVCMVLYSLSFE
eukprot:COSAG01_NODE_15521_length_1327_cov_1.616450_3_plen_181_part_00